ncbi:flagellar protein FlaG [Desulfurispira natronophila]|uniref:Flagellar protein FlaG n=1 Tax=Desulfurispira natronophila TaxID=682562 RepID=A0A7W8DH16_9BACT|nr:flagellar protein FlaG [Desulfurispira natronophila]MBB5021944.1 flagellar protein FlaG [Desulfurispira natronophila]
MQIDTHSIGSPSGTGHEQQYLRSRQAAAEQAQNKTAEQKKQVPGRENSSGKQEAPSEQELRKAVEELNRNMDFLNVSRRFEVHEDTEKLVVKLMDKESGDLIRQIPSEDAIKRMTQIRDFLGQLYDENA